jgi:uncharacterized membrane protein
MTHEITLVSILLFGIVAVGADVKANVNVFFFLSSRLIYETHINKDTFSWPGFALF